VQRLRPYVPGKAVEEVQRELGLDDVVKLASNENPWGPSPRAVAAIRAAAAGIGHYPDAAGHRLTRALAANWGVAPEQVVLGNGSDEILHYLGVTYLEAGDEVLTGSPSFLRYEAAATLAGAEYVAVPLADYRFDLVAMRERLSPRTRLVFIANPNNPTGTVVGRAELERFLDAVPERAVVALDEAYFEYVDDATRVDGLEYVRAGRNVIVLRTFSKIYGLAGLRIGYGMARPEIIAALHQVREPFNVNMLAQEAALASLEDADQVPRARAANAAGRRFLAERLAALGLACVPSQANFVLVNLGREARDVCSVLLRRGVIVRSDPLWELPAHVRVTVGTPEQNDRFLRELAAVLGVKAGE
jgi:histidinol-phosphate aminotransferase